MSRPKKRLGQHFLSDPRILARIADALAPEPGDVVVEIGPGPGGLTAQLAARPGRVVAIEKDVDLVPALRARYPSVSVVEADALEHDWHDVAGPPDGGRFLVTGNIPYNITSPLIDRALRPPLPERIVFLVQKEVAERVAAPPGQGSYGALSVGVQAVVHVERLFTVPAGAFHPPPKVDSAVLRMTPLADPLVAEDDRPAFRRFVVGLFGFRRKQLQKGLRELTGLGADAVASALSASALDPAARPEVLAPAEFARLYRVLHATLDRVDAGEVVG